MSTVQIRFPCPPGREHPAAVALLNVLRLQRREFAATQSAAEKHRQNRTVPFSFHGFYGGLSEQVARPFLGEPVPCPGAGLADALEGHDALGHAAIEQSVFGRFCRQLADRREPQIDGGRLQSGAAGEFVCKLGAADGSPLFLSGDGRL